MKKLLIIGANPETISLIEKAKLMGIKTYVTDYNKMTYAKSLRMFPVMWTAWTWTGLLPLSKRNTLMRFW